MDIACSDNKETCCIAAVDRYVVACSGGSNVGQITNLAAVRMMQEGLAHMTCLAALGAHLQAYIESVSDTELVVLDGCPVACGKQVVEHIGIKDYKYFVISELGIAKAKEFDQVKDDIHQVWERIINAL